MTRVTFTNPGGAGTATVTVEASRGATLLEVAEECGARVGHACGGNLACSTCHVWIEHGAASLPDISDAENDILDRAFDVRAESRLACQCRVGTADLVVEITEESHKAWLDENPDVRRRGA